MSAAEDDETSPDSAPDHAIPRAGDLIDGKYRVGEAIGEGGMGLVLAGEHTLLKQPVAIKVLSPKYAADKGFRARFLREARTAAGLTSDHAVRIMDVGTTENRLPFMVMERLVGESLEARVERGPLPAAQAVDIVLQALVALAEAHGRGLVHRDLKPGNLFLVPRDDGTTKVKVLDFGISKLLGDADPSISDASLTAPRTLLGSPLYMSPEQLRDASAVDARTDVWAMGVVLFELLTGRAPFESDSVPELYAKILNDPPPPLRSLAPTAPPALELVIERCLAKERNDRYPDAPALSRALTALVAGLASGTDDTLAGPGEALRAAISRTLAIAIALGALVLLGVAIGAWNTKDREVATTTKIPPPPASESAGRSESLVSAPESVALPPSPPPNPSADAGPSKPAEAGPAAKPGAPPRVRDLKQIRLIE